MKRLLCTLVILVGCKGAGPLSPELEVAIEAPSHTKLGARAVAELSATERSFDCTNEGLYATVLNCEHVALVEAAFVTISCAPATACGSISIDYPRSASWVSLAASYELKLAADVRGRRHERTVQVTAESPMHSFDGTTTSNTPVAGVDHRVCLDPPVPSADYPSATTLDLELDGVPLATRDVERAALTNSVRCVTVTPPRPGNLRAIARLEEGGLEVGRLEQRVRDVGEATALTILDADCASKKIWADGRSGTWSVEVHVKAVFADGTSGFAPETVLAYHDGEQTLLPAPLPPPRFGPKDPSALFLLPSAPSEAAIVSARAGTAALDAAVFRSTTGRCY